MKKQSEEPTPPDPLDLDGWRRVIANGDLKRFRPEAIVAALQDIDRAADQRVTNALAKHLTHTLSGMLRKLIGPNHPNNGEDIIASAAEEVFKAVLRPHSADGRALREAFYPRVRFRAKDAIATEYRHSRVPLVPRVREPEGDEDEDDIPFDTTKAAELANLLHRGVAPDDFSDSTSDDDDSGHPDTATLAVADHIGGYVDTERVLAGITDWRKRQAFRLYMEKVPFGSKKFFAIAKAVGRSTKTVETWIEELRHDLQATDKVQELIGKKAGEQS
jgi:DNA-directed RNA polymerase specialized sigma24 family protein